MWRAADLGQIDLGCYNSDIPGLLTSFRHAGGQTYELFSLIHCRTSREWVTCSGALDRSSQHGLAVQRAYGGSGRCGGAVRVGEAEGLGAGDVQLPGGPLLRLHCKQVGPGERCAAKGVGPGGRDGDLGGWEGGRENGRGQGREGGR